MKTPLFRSPFNKFFSRIAHTRQQFSFHTDDAVKLIETYREFDSYKVDVEVYPKTKIHIPKKLPSEPEDGITYTFEQTGYMGDIGSAHCVIPCSWKNVHNYCHWSFSELPVLHLAFSSPAETILLPASLLETSLPLAFEQRWLEVLKARYPGKTLEPLSKQTYTDILIPVNHDTSSSNVPVGKCAYKHYHHSRATPYTIQMVDEMKMHFDRFKDLRAKRFYINRTSRRLQNEEEVQSYLKSQGYVILNLEDLTLDDQVHLFMNAEAIIGFHGAGLANLLFCNTNSKTKVLEIVDRDCVHPSYLDGVVVPGVKATRTYFHMLAHMKNLAYEVVESDAYVLDMQKLKTAIAGW